MHMQARRCNSPRARAPRLHCADQDVGYSRDLLLHAFLFDHSASGSIPMGIIYAGERYDPKDNHKLELFGFSIAFVTSVCASERLHLIAGCRPPWIHTAR
jgi:hypothetical protein